MPRPGVFCAHQTPDFFADSGCRCVWIWAIPPKYWITTCNFQKKNHQYPADFGVPYFQTTTSAMRLAAAQFCLQRRDISYIVHLKGEEFVINHAFAKAYPAYPSLTGVFLVHILWKKNNWYLVTFAHMVGFMMKSMKVPVFFLQSPLIVDKPPFWWLEAPSSSNIHLCCVNLHSCYSSLKPPFFLLKPQFLWFTLW